MSSSHWRPSKKRKSPTDNALTAPSTSTHCSSTASAGDHSSAEIQNNQRNNDKEADFLSFITKISNSVRGLSDHFICPVCLDLLSDSHVAPECLHHFCGDCIKESLHRCKNECPACRSSICTRRSLRKDKSFDLIVKEFRDLSTLIEGKLKELEARAILETSNPSDAPNVETSNKSVPNCDNDDGSDSSVCFLGTKHAPIIQHQTKRSRPVKPPPTIMEMIYLDSMSSDCDSKSEQSSDDEEWTTKQSPSKNNLKNATKCNVRPLRKSNLKKDDDDADVDDDDSSDDSYYLSPSVGTTQRLESKKTKSLKGSCTDEEASQKAKEQKALGQPKVQVGSTADDSSESKKSVIDGENRNGNNIKIAKGSGNKVACKIWLDSSDDSDSGLFDEILNITPFQTDNDKNVGKVSVKEKNDEFCNYKHEEDDDNEDEDKEKETIRFSPPETYSSEKLDERGTWSATPAAAAADHEDCCKREPEKVAYGGLKAEDVEHTDGNRCNQQRPSRQRQVTQRYGNMLSDYQIDAYLSAWKM